MQCARSLAWGQLPQDQRQVLRPDTLFTYALQPTALPLSVPQLADPHKLQAQAAVPHSVQPHMMRSRAGNPPLCSLQTSRHFPGLRPVSHILPAKRTPAGMTKPAGMTTPAESAVAYVCATSAPDLATIVHGLIAVKAKGKQQQQHVVRFLVDTGATESCISEAFVNEIGAPVRSKLETLSMANGSVAQSKGSVVLPIICKTTGAKLC